MTAAIIVDETLGTYEVHSVTKIEQVRERSGATRFEEAGNPVRITMAVDGNRFMHFFLDVINGRLID